MYRAAIINDRECRAEVFDDYSAALDWGWAKLRRLENCLDSGSVCITKNGELIVNILPSDQLEMINGGANGSTYVMSRSF